MKKALLPAVLLVFCLPGWGQVLGTITGEVRDQTGAVAATASVTIINTSTNAARETQTNNEGLYTVPGLQPGPYEVKVQMVGFRSVAQKLELQVQQTARVDFSLQVGEVTTEVEVSAMAAQLTTENATVGTVIENRRIVDLPLNGRNFLALVALSPNVTTGFSAQGNNDRQGGQRVQQNIAVSGMRGVWNNYTLDGSANTDPNMHTYVVLPSVDFLQEFKVQTGIYPAEFGHEATQINVSTKAGTNTYHGTLYEFVRNDKMDAKPYAFTPAQSALVKNPFQWNQYGFTFGGPVRIPGIVNGRDKLFFNTNWERFRQRTRSNSYYSVPSAAMRSGDFSELSGVTLYDPTGRSLAADGKTVLASTFPNNKIPVSRLSPQAAVLWNYWPAPNVPSQAAAGQTPYNNYFTVLRGPINRDQFNARLDWNESEKSQWFARFGWTDEVETSQGIYLNGSKLLDHAYQYTIANTRTFGPTLVNEFRAAASIFFNSTSRELAYQQDVISMLKIPGLTTPNPATWGIPRMEGFPGLSGFGDNSSGPFVLNDTMFAVNDNMSWIHGKHAVRFGGEIRRDRYNNFGNEFPRGSFDFNGQETANPNTGNNGYSVADFYLGQLQYGEAAVALAFDHFRATPLALYVDDTWRISPKLTLSLGLRWEYNPPWVDASGKAVNTYVPRILNGQVNVADMSLHPVEVRNGTGNFYDGLAFRYLNVQVARDGRLGDALTNTYHNDWAPRIGIAYSPTARWSVRFGAGIFYSAETGNSRFDLSRNLAGRTRVNNSAQFPTVTMENFLTQGGAGQGSTYFNLATPYALGQQMNLPTANTIQYLLNIQRELSASTIFEMGYAGSFSRKLEYLMDLNQGVPSASGVKVPFPEFNAIQTIAGDGRANYNALSGKLSRRFASGLSALVSYTWSKSIDNVSAIRGQSYVGAQYPQDSNCISCEKAVSDFNVPQRVVASVMYELPVGKGKKFGNWTGVGGTIANGFIGGWQLSGIFTAQYGLPFMVTESPRANVNMQLNARTNATGLDPYAANKSTNGWLNPAAFSLQPVGSFGNEGRNVLIGPGTKHLDFSAIKNFRIREGHTLNFRIETFNLPNHPDWQIPSYSWGSTNPTVPSSSFGLIRSTTSSMRQIQLGLKYSF